MSDDRRGGAGLWIGATAVALAGVCAACAWVSEDAHITFRTIDNFVNGHGLRWNVDERVQTYTHPLWLLVNSIPYFFTREIYFTTAAIGLVCSIGAYVQLARMRNGGPLDLVVGLFVPLVLSVSFVRYATSGFETSLTFLLLAIFAGVLTRCLRDERVSWLALTLVPALAAINRLDTILLYVPGLAVVAWHHRSNLRWGLVVLGALPFALWAAFASFYYGFVLSNTALAKLNHEIPPTEYLEQGFVYLGDLLASDPVSFLWLASAWVVVAWFAGERLRGREAAIDAGVALALGSVIYSVYVLSVGGDFLTGRVWVPAVFAAICGFATRSEPIPMAWRSLSRRGVVGLAAAALCLSGVWLLVRTPLRDLAREQGIRDRALAHRFLGRDLQWGATERYRTLAELGRAVRAEAEATGSTKPIPTFAIGVFGFEAGPRITIVDLNALADPLLARLPPDPREHWMIGHFGRAAPAGYLHARETGSTDRMEPGLAEYYEHLRRVTSGPLWDTERLATIAAFHLGRYDALLPTAP
ncbi:MAG: hypothetical protein VX246_12365 [Myxococcota bacterium]|nr:hypothetical protein [Myxococcota bacterium]